VVGVYVKDQISAKPALLIHFSLWAFVISARVINIRRNSLAEKQSQSVNVCEPLMPLHDSLFKEKKSEFSLTKQRGRRNKCRRVAVKIRKLFVNEISGRRNHLSFAPVLLIRLFLYPNLTINPA
jgi:hypothetical protein